MTLTARERIEKAEKELELAKQELAKEQAPKYYVEYQSEPRSGKPEWRKPVRMEHPYDTFESAMDALHDRLDDFANRALASCTFSRYRIRREG